MNEMAPVEFWHHTSNQTFIQFNGNSKMMLLPTTKQRQLNYWHPN